MKLQLEILYWPLSARKKRYRGYKKAGLKHGLCITYCPTGTVLTRERWKRGKQNGISTYYDFWGYMERRSNFTDGKKDGWEYLWYQGKLASKRLYDKGKVVTTEVIFNPPSTEYNI